MLPQHPPPPPWAGAGPPQGPATEVAPWAVASQRLTDFNAGGLVDGEASRWWRWRARRRRHARRLLPRLPGAPTRQRRPVALGRPPVPGGLPRRPERHHPPAVPRLQRVQSHQPRRGTTRVGRGDRGVHLATPRRRRCARRPSPLAGLGRGAWFVPISSTSGCPTRPSATAAGRPSSAAGAALVDRLAGGGLAQRRRRHLRVLLDRGRRWSCPSRLRWYAWPSSHGRGDRHGHRSRLASAARGARARRRGRCLSLRPRVACRESRVRELFAGVAFRMVRGLPAAARK